MVTKRSVPWGDERPGNIFHAKFSTNMVSSNTDPQV
jgi:hypothetical protein